MRRMAAAMRSSKFGDLEAAINGLLQAIPILQASWIELIRGADTGRTVEVDTANLVLPITSGKMVVGGLKRPVANAAFGAEELRFLAAAADLVGAIVSLSGDVTESREFSAALGFALDQVPVAVVCLRSNGTVLCFNRAAATIAGKSPSDVGLPEFFAGTLSVAAGSAEVVSFSDRLVLASVAPGSRGSSAACAKVVMLIDLTERAAAFADLIEREIYRALWLAQPLTLVVAAASRLPELIASTETMDLWLPGFCGAGPVDMDTFGILVRGRRSAEVRLALRKERRLLAVECLRMGIAEVASGVTNARGLVDGALRTMSAATSLTRPSLLLWDGSSSVTDALSIALRDASETIACNDRRQCLQLVAERSFDGIFAEMNLDDLEPDLDLVRTVLGSQPGIVPFLVADAPGPYRFGDKGLPENTTVFRKPFSVVQVRAAVAEHFSV